MALGPRLEVRQAATLVMTPQVQQAIRLLALSNVELEAAITAEVAANPLLDIVSADGGESVVATVDRETGAAEPEPPGADELIGSRIGTEDMPLDYDWNAAARQDDCFADAPLNSAEQPFDFDRLSIGTDSLADHLLGQLGSVDGKLRELAARIVHELEDTGYLLTPLTEIAAATGTDPAQVKAALTIVHGFDPPGIGARDLAECLSLQARAADRYDPAMERLIANLDLLARGERGALKRICEVDDEDLTEMIRELRNYDPKPGCRFTTAAAVPPAPDLLVRRDADGWRVEFNSATLPRLIVNRRYHQELRAGAASKEARAWLGDQLASASWLVRALDQRARTIVKVASEIVKQQERFFTCGVSALKPLTLAKVADAVGLHESTVSRVAANKTLLCDRGSYELKYFFGSGVAAGDGADGASAEAVKNAIGRLIAQETQVLSDDVLVGLLKAQGFDLARRTVAKYREAMNIGSSVERRRQRLITGKAA